MMIYRHIYLWFLLLPLSSYCQVEYFEYDHPNAIELDATNLELLTSRNWYFYEALDILKQDTLRTKLNGRIKYNPAGDYQFDYLSGKWMILKGKFLKHVSYSDEQARRKKFGGTYAIIKLDEEELVLNKLQTSNRDMMKTIYLTSERKLYPMSYLQSLSDNENLDSASIQKLSNMSIK